MARKNETKKVTEPKAGMKYRGLDRDLWHVVGTLPDGGYTLVVSKSWAKYKNRWVYEVYSDKTFEWLMDHQDELKKTCKKKVTK